MKPGAAGFAKLPWSLLSGSGDVGELRCVAFSNIWPVDKGRIYTTNVAVRVCFAQVAYAIIAV